MLNPHFYCLL